MLVTQDTAEADHAESDVKFTKDQAVRNQTQIFSVAVWLLNEQMKQSHWPMTLGQAHVHHSELI